MQIFNVFWSIKHEVDLVLNGVTCHNLIISDIHIFHGDYSDYRDRSDCSVCWATVCLILRAGPVSTTVSPRPPLGNHRTRHWTVEGLTRFVVITCHSYSSQFRRSFVSSHTKGTYYLISCNPFQSDTFSIFSDTVVS